MFFFYCNDDNSSLIVEPLLRLNCDISADFFSAECSSSLDGIISLVYSCSLNNQPPTICEINLCECSWFI